MLAAQYYGDAPIDMANLRTWRRKLVAFPKKDSARPPYYGSFSRTRCVPERVWCGCNGVAWCGRAGSPWQAHCAQRVVLLRYKRVTAGHAALQLWMVPEGL